MTRDSTGGVLRRLALWTAPLWLAAACQGLRLGQESAPDALYLSPDARGPSTVPVEEGDSTAPDASFQEEMEDVDASDLMFNWTLMQTMEMLSDGKPVKGKEEYLTQAEGKLVKALEVVKKRGPRDLTYASTLDALARVYQAQGKPAEATPLYERALAIRRAVLPPDHFDLLESLYALTKLYADLERHEDALPLCLLAMSNREGLEKGHDDIELFQVTEQCLRFLREAGRGKEAGELQERVNAVLVAVVTENRIIAERAYGNELWDTAVGYYLSCVEFMENMGRAEHPDIAAYMNGAGKAWTKDGKPGPAAGILMKASLILAGAGEEHDALQAEVLGNLGLAFLALEKLNRAFFAFERALAIARRSRKRGEVDLVPIVGGLARTYHKQGRGDEAEPLYRLVLQMQQRKGSPRDLDWARNLESYAALLRETGRADASARLLAMAKRIRGMDTRLRAAEEVARKKKSKDWDQDYYDRQIKEANRGLREDPGNAYEYYMDRAYGYEQKDMYAEALADKTKAIESDPENPRAYNSRASTYWDLGEFEKAVADMTKVIEIKDGSYFHDYFRRGSMHYEKGDFDSAIKDFDAAIERHATYAASHRKRGLCYLRRGDHEKALADFNKAIELEPDEYKVHRERAALYAEMGKLDLALADYNAWVAHSCCEHHKYGPRGRFYLYYMRDKRKAITDFRDWVKLAPDDIFGAIWLHFALRMDGQDGVAELANLAKGLDKEKWPYPAVRLYLGEAQPDAFLAAIGGKTKKEKLERKCEALFFVGKLHALRGGRRKARELFEKCVATGVHYFVEYHAAKLELKLLEQTPLRQVFLNAGGAPMAGRAATNTGRPRLPDLVAGSSCRSVQP